jgi:hypothetical protein
MGNATNTIPLWVTNTIPLWVTVLGLAIPLITLAGSALAYVVRLYIDGAERRRKQFFELMQFIDSKEPIAAKVAAVYQLRSFPEHRDFIIRFCGSQRGNIVGPASNLLSDEMDKTREHMVRLQSKQSGR